MGHRRLDRLRNNMARLESLDPSLVDEAIKQLVYEDPEALDDFITEGWPITIKGIDYLPDGLELRLRAIELLFEELFGPVPDRSQ